MAGRGSAESCMQSGEDLLLVLVARDRSGATADFLVGAVSKDGLRVEDQVQEPWHIF